MAHNMAYNKFRNQKTTVDEITFHSKDKAARYQELKLMEKLGRTRALRNSR